MAIKVNNPLNYISLFSCAGVGCYGFKQEGFSCIASVELEDKRLEIQKFNNKCKYDTGYICGDIKLDSTKQAVFTEIKKWEKKEKINGVDVIIATPPCQGISDSNHKKRPDEINRNSLVVESIELVDKIRPKVFIFENVKAFMKTLCVSKDERVLPIMDYIREVLGANYVISGNVLNFMYYGSNSSRTRTLVIGVEKKYRDVITPLDLFPDFQKEKTLEQVIRHLPTLEWGEISKDDFYHAFRTYDVEMRAWIHDLLPGECAFDQKDPLKRPHQIKNGVIIENAQKNRDKYTRQRWDRFVQCVQTRNDQLAAQNTIHPEQDRVFSIRELMEMMTIPSDFRWYNFSLEQLNSLSLEEKRKLYKANEINIRQCIGEAVPTIIIQQIASKIRSLFTRKICDSCEVNRIIGSYHLDCINNLKTFLQGNPEQLDLPTLMRITELCNARRDENAAFYTNKFLVNEIIDKLPSFNKEVIHILEPSVGAGGFLPFLFIKYVDIPHVVIDAVDIDENSIENLKLLMQNVVIPPNFEINYICSDFILYDAPYTYDLAIGNPPYANLKKRTPTINLKLWDYVNQTTNDLAGIFLEKCIRISDCVALVLNKSILSGEEYQETYNLLRRIKIDTIIDFGRYGFTGLSIETIAIILKPKEKPSSTMVYSLKFNKSYKQNQSYITDKKYPFILIYRDEEFDRVAEKLNFGIFNVIRDRQITKSVTTSEKNSGSIWVLKARNVNDDGSGVTHIDGYDVYVDNEIAKKLAVYPYFNNPNIYLTPNMTYNTRVIRNIKGIVPDGSVAVLIPKRGIQLTENQLKYFSSAEYRRFYLVARNLSTQSINVDKTSVYFFGILKDDK
ncbi:MAG: DNA cytosine methyltransferase [Bacteroidales bacterium]|nr:DNA cytosine methyltransferase [Bacteroidales bacterium]